MRSGDICRSNAAPVIGYTPGGRPVRPIAGGSLLTLKAFQQRKAAAAPIDTPILLDSAAAGSGTSLTGNSRTFTQGHVYLVYGAGERAAGTNPIPTLSGAGMTWTDGKSGAEIGGASAATWEWFVGYCISTTTAALTLDFAGVAQIYCSLQVFDLGVNTAGTSANNGLDAIFQSEQMNNVQNTSTGTNANGIYAPMQAFADGTNSVLLWVHTHRAGEHAKPFPLAGTALLDALGGTANGWNYTSHYLMAPGTGALYAGWDWGTTTGANGYGFEIAGKAVVARGSKIRRHRLVSGTSGATSTNYATSTTLPTGGRFQVLDIMWRRSAATTVLSVVGDGITWSQAGATASVTVGGFVYAVATYIGCVVTPTSGTVVVTLNATCSGFAYAWTEYDGTAATTGNNGTDGFRNVNTNSNAATTSLVVTMGAFGSPNNGTHCVVWATQATSTITAASVASDTATITANNGFTAGQEVRQTGVTSTPTNAYNTLFPIASASGTQYTAIYPTQTLTYTSGGISSAAAVGAGFARAWLNSTTPGVIVSMDKYNNDLAPSASFVSGGAAAVALEIISA